MKTFKVEVKETLTRIVTIQAESETDAVSQVKSQYDDGGIILDSADCLDSEIAIFKIS